MYAEKPGMGVEPIYSGSFLALSITFTLKVQDCSLIDKGRQSNVLFTPKKNCRNPCFMK
jgi:hypothetical protein